MGDRITRKIKHGVVLVELEESVLVVKYDMEQVCHPATALLCCVCCAFYICYYMGYPVRPRAQYDLGCIMTICLMLCCVILRQVRVDEHGRVLEVLDRKPETRRIKIKVLTPDKDLAQMSEDIIEKCKFIHPSRKEEIEQLLIKLRKYQIANPPKTEEEVAKERANKEGAAAAPEDRGSKRGDRDRDRDRDRRAEEARRPPPEVMLPPASMDELDDYLELLYQVSGKTEKDKDKGMESQVRGTAMILQLCRHVVNLEVLIQNGTLMGALTRVLQEEYKKSLDLTFNILRYAAAAIAISTATKL